MKKNMLEIPILECQKLIGYGPFWHRRGRFSGQLGMAHHTHHQGMVSLGTCVKFERQRPSSRGERSGFVQGSICRPFLQKRTPQYMKNTLYYLCEILMHFFSEHSFLSKYLKNLTRISSDFLNCDLSRKECSDRILVAKIKFYVKFCIDIGPLG